MHRTYVGRLERGESGVTVEAQAAVGVSLGEFFAVQGGGEAEDSEELTSAQTSSDTRKDIQPARRQRIPSS